MQKQLNLASQALSKQIRDVTLVAEKLFKGMPIRVWFVKLGECSWKCIIIHTDNKIKLAQGAIRASPLAALNIVRVQLQSIVGNVKSS